MTTLIQGQLKFNLCRDEATDVIYECPKYQGAFTKYVDKIVAFFDHLSVYIFYGITVDKKSIFSTTYPPPLVHVV